MLDNTKDVERIETEELIQLLKTLPQYEKIFALGIVKWIELMSQGKRDKEAM